MNYQSYPPHPDLESIVNCYWTLEVPADKNVKRQRIIPDGCIEMAFLLGDDIKRYTSEDEFILQPRAMVIGQIIEPFYIQPTGYVNTFAVRFYPYGFSNFVTIPIQDLSNKETPLNEIFGANKAKELENNVIIATDAYQRIALIEKFLLAKFNDKVTIDNVVKMTIDALLASNGSEKISSILNDYSSKRRQLERNFVKQIGVSPKQLGKVIRLQSALKMILNKDPNSLTSIAYANEYFDQAHFIKDFKEFTGVSPKEFLGNQSMTLSKLFYK